MIINTSIGGKSSLEDGSVTTAKIADNAVTFDKLSVYARPIGENMIINHYFVGGGSQQGEGQFPINQRGKTVYIGNGYAIDRWRISGDTSLNLEIKETGIEFTKTSSSTAYFVQPLEPVLVSSLRNKKVTLSILTDSSLFAGTVVFTERSGIVIHMENSILFRLRASDGEISIYFPATSSTLTVRAVKLELGDHQTLAHQDKDGNWVINEIPDYDTELLNCRRYQKVIKPVSVFGRYGDGIVADAVNLAYINLSLTTPLRSTPAINFTGNLVIWDGKNPYAVSSIVLDRLSTDTCSVKVTFNGSLAIGTYVLLMSANTVDSQILLDANL